MVPIEEREMFDFITKTLIIDMTQRLTSEDGLDHPWFRDLNQSKNGKGSTGPGP